MLAKGAFLAADDGVEVSTTTQRGLGNVLLSGTGFFVLRASGQGTLAVAAHGAILSFTLAPGEVRAVDNGHLVAWSEHMAFEMRLASASRSTSLLGAAFSWAIPMAFAAETESVPEIAWLLFTTNLLWTVAYDTEYAMCDREDDLKVGIKSTAILFGDLDKVMVGALQVLTLVALWVLGQRLGFTWPWYLGLAGMAAGFAHQQWRIRYREPWPCFHAFLSNHWAGASVFAGLYFQYLLAAPGP